MDFHLALDESLQEFDEWEVVSSETATKDEASLKSDDGLEDSMKDLILGTVFEDSKSDSHFPLICHPDTSFIDPQFEKIHEEIEDDYELPVISQDLYEDFSFKRFIDEPEDHDVLRIGSYLEMCNILETPPLSSVIESVEKETMDLKHQRMDSHAMRAVMDILRPNATVKRLDLSYVTLVPRAAYFLGEILLSNNNIEELNLSFCRLGPEGIKQLKTGLIESCVSKLDLTQNAIGDDGMRHLAEVLSQGNYLRTVIMKHNGFGGKSAEILAECLSDDCRLEELDLSWNNLSGDDGMHKLLRSLAGNQSVKTLNLAWTGLGGTEAAVALRYTLLNNHVLTYLDISNNLLSSEDILTISEGIAGNIKLLTLIIGHNHLTPEDCTTLLLAVVESRVRNVDMGNAWVDKSFLEIRDGKAKMKRINVIFGGVSGDYDSSGPHLQKLYLASAKYEAQSPKNVKQKRDFGLFLLQIENEKMSTNDFVKLLKKEKIKLDSSLITELTAAFEVAEEGMIDISAMKSVYLEMYPDTELPKPKELPKKVESKKKKKPAKEKV